MPLRERLRRRLFAPPNFTPEEAPVWANTRLMPILTLLYLFSFLDRGTSSDVFTAPPDLVTPSVIWNIGS